MMPLSNSTIKRIERLRREAQLHLRALSKAGGVLEPLARRYAGNLDKLQASVNEIHGRVGRAMTPTVRRLVLSNYDSSGVGKTSKGYKPTGDLRAAIASCSVVVGLRGIYVRLPEGGSDKLYTYAGALQYGAIRQPLTKAKGSLYKDLPTGEFRQRKKAAGFYGEKAKRTLKKKMEAAGSRRIARGGSYVPPKHIFELPGGSESALKIEYTERFEAEVRAMMKKA